MTDSLLDWGVAVRSRQEMDEPGDQYLVREYRGGALVAVVDGLGHGPAAANAAKMAIAVLDEHAEDPPARLLKRCHERLRDTRGVVASLAVFGGSTMTWLGVGDVDGLLLRASAQPRSTERLVARSGVVGGHLPRLQPERLPVAPGDTLIFTTDGIGGGFATVLTPDFAPKPTAERILFRYGKPTDDALVLVVRYLGRDG